LEKAIALFVKKNDLHLAAISCVELALFYMEHQQLQNAMDSYQQAADYYGADRRRNHGRAQDFVNGYSKYKTIQRKVEENVTKPWFEPKTCLHKSTWSSQQPSYTNVLELGLDFIQSKNKLRAVHMI
jgi:hypothetical protein